MANSTSEYFEANRRNWDERAQIHVDSGYGIDRLIHDSAALSDVVDFDRKYLGNIAGLDAVHLQCHVGTDTLSLARLGARVVGLDQSPASLGHARSLFDATGAEGRFVEGDVYDASTLIDDLVYTGVGAINWLPSIGRWAEVVGGLLVPGGRVYLREGHPMLSTLDDDASNGLVVTYPYFERDEPMVFDHESTYVESTTTIGNTRTYEWNHGIGEVFTALADHGMEVTLLQEHRGLEWKMWDHMVEEDRQWKLPVEQRDLVPVMYSMMATRRP